MTKYEKELQELKPWDDVQITRNGTSKFPFIVTAGHGYLAIPRRYRKAFSIASSIVEAGFVGKHAIYLEEDSEVLRFKEIIA